MTELYASSSRATVSAVARLASAAAAALLLVVAPARAGESATPLQARVAYGDLDTTTAAGASALYERILVAARRVCPDDASRSLRVAQSVRSCRREAVARAVESFGNPQLAAVHSKRQPSG